VLQDGLVLALLALSLKKLLESQRFPQVALVGAGGSGPLNPPPSAAPDKQVILYKTCGKWVQPLS